MANKSRRARKRGLRGGPRSAARRSAESGQGASERARRAGRGGGRHGWGGQGAREWGRSRGEGGSYRDSYENEAPRPASRGDDRVSGGSEEGADRPDAEGGLGDRRQGAYGGENEWAASERPTRISGRGRAAKRRVRGG